MDAQRLRAIQAALRDERLDGWLFYDFRGSDPLAYRILGLDSGTLSTRRWYYFVPDDGPPVGLVSTVEPHRLDDLPGTTRTFFTWQEHDRALAGILRGPRRIAMQYSPRNAIPYVARVDAGTLELVRESGVEVVSSANLVQRFEAVWTDAQWHSHVRAADAVGDTVHAAFDYLRSAAPVSEYEVQRFILERFARHGLTTHHPPVVAAGAHSADPHYTPGPEGSAVIRSGDFVLIDLWAKEPHGVYADVTWTGFMGTSVPDRYRTIFEVVRNARDAAVAFVEDRIGQGQAFSGHEVDAAARAVITDAGYGDRFIHRTGHSIGKEVHGNGANMDGAETRDTRRVLPRTCFSIEPGIYLPGEFGVRSEIDVYVTERDVRVTGRPAQTEVVPICR